MDLSNIRKQIDSIDEQLVALLEERAKLSIEVGKTKSNDPNARYFAPERERDIIARIVALHGDGPHPKDGLIAIFREIISASIALQKPIGVAYWGPKGTFTQMAAMQRFGSSANYHDCPTIPDVFGEVERGQADFGVVPIENSTEGVVEYTLDMFRETTLTICAEVNLTIVQNLATHAKSLAEIKRVYTGPQPHGQCRQWLDAHLPGVEIVGAMPTSKAAMLAAADPEGAAIVPRLASEIYELPMLFEHIEDSPHNRTRFLVVGRNEPPPTGKDKTSILFAVKNEPGALFRALRAFEKHNVNLTMIASRPSRNAAWEYIQFVDFQGHERDEPVKSAVAELKAHSIYVTVLGSYPEG